MLGKCWYFRRGIPIFQWPSASSPHRPLSMKHQDVDFPHAFGGSGSGLNHTDLDIIIIELVGFPLPAPMQTHISLQERQPRPSAAERVARPGGKARCRGHGRLKELNSFCKRSPGFPTRPLVQRLPDQQQSVSNSCWDHFH